jgi:23S rRNA pseudouridine1911/1915/1917 synthase
LKSFTNIPILYQDQEVMIVLKPSGLSTESGHAAHPSAESQLHAELAQRSGRAVYLRAVHRLDRPASGILILAKSKAALTKIMAAFESRKVKKTYEALVTGNLIPDSGSLSHWHMRDESGKTARILDAPEQGAQLAALQYQVLERNGQFTRLEIKPEQGRFHQIRAQLGAVGWPIVGDVMYGGEALDEPNSIRLHAKSLTFEDSILAPVAILNCDAPW